MKIAMIGHKRIPGREGGVEVVVEELSTRLAAAGNEIVVYNRKSKKFKAFKQYKNIRIITIPTIERKSTDAVVYSFLATICALFGHYDVIHYHTIGSGFFMVIPHLFGIHTVVTVHGLNYKTPKWKGFGAQFIQLGERITAKYADEVIVLSKDQQNYFWKKYHRKTNHIPNGVSIQPIVPAKVIKSKYGLDKDGYILFLSRLVPGKGVEYLIKAYQRIDTKIPLIIAGDAPFVSEFIKRIKNEASRDQRIRFIGFVENEELCELYSNAKLFVFPSEAEGMPMCLLEAMSYNTPCLVSNIPENIEVGKPFMKFFENKNVDDLTSKMQECLTAPGNDNLDSRSFVKRKYDWSTIVDDTLRCYINCIQRR